MQALLRFYEHANRLKTLKRAGWGRCGVSPCESVADHTFGVAVLALLADANVDRERCVALALVHDLAESIIGDITPHDGISAHDKRQREEAAIREITSTLGDDRVLELWREFEDGQSPEAKLARDLDVVEMALQARIFQRDGRLTAEQANQFVISAESRVTGETAKRLLACLSKQSSS